MMPKSITVGELLNNEHYVQVTGDEKSLERPIYVAEINRPGFELAGFFKHSDFRRIIIFGDKESAFINEMSEERQREIFPFLINDEVPCIIVAKGNECPAILIEIARKKDFPIFITESATGRVSIELTNILDEALAPETLIHGVFLNIYGKGVIIKGDSGIGKSEIALELVKRGHLLVADDAVESCYNGLCDRLEALIEKKYAGYLEDPEDLKSVNKAKNGLVRAGYDYDDINKAIKDFLEK